MASRTAQPPQQPAGEQEQEQERERERGVEMSESQTVMVTPPPSSHQDQDNEDLKKCWICFSDESEDVPETSAWRDPCPCALVAHEDCLLDWIADMESPTSRKRTLGPPHIACPQCKADIHLVRPRNPLVEVVRALERLAGKGAIPAALAIGFSAFVHTFTAHGVHSVYQVFGPRDARRILTPLFQPLFKDVSQWSFLERLQYLARHWRLRVGLPLITPLLVLSRTTLADSVLPVLPIVFFATQGDPQEPLDLGSWPPSASMTMAILPYIRSAYNLYYDKVWAEREKKWLQAIQPRSGRGDRTDDQQPGQDLEDPLVQGDNNFEIRIDGGIWEDWADPVPENNAAPPLNAPPLPDNDPAARPQNPPAQPPPQQPQQGREERVLSLSTTALAENVIGALLFPTIAALSGDALKYILPTSWTSLPAQTLGLGRPKATGLLQEKWGRSIIGGCLFVVVKDAVMLYVRWKMAQQHHRRRVLDYDRKTKRAR